jgi:hypothetical protein
MKVKMLRFGMFWRTARQIIAGIEVMILFIAGDVILAKVRQIYPLMYGNDQNRGEIISNLRSG